MTAMSYTVTHVRVDNHFWVLKRATKLVLHLGCHVCRWPLENACHSHRDGLLVCCVLTTYLDLGSDRVKHEWFLIDTEVKEARYSSAGMSLWTPIWGCLRSQDWVGSLSPLGCCNWLNTETLLTSRYWWNIEFKLDMVSPSPIGICRWNSLHYLLCMSCYVPMTLRRIDLWNKGEDKSLNVFVRLCSTFDARRPVWSWVFSSSLNLLMLE